MGRRSSILISLAVLAFAVGTGRTAPQNSQYTPAEYSAFQAARHQEHPQEKLKLLDEFVATYPNSILITAAYREYSAAYFIINKFPESVEFIDKFLSRLDGVGSGGLPDGMFGSSQRLDGLYLRAQAYFADCYDNAFHSQEAYARARAAAAQGLQSLSQWQKPSNMPDWQFEPMKTQAGLLFRTVEGITDSGLKGTKPADFCKAASAPDPSRFDGILNRLNTSGAPKP